MKKSIKVKNIILSTSFIGLVGVVAISTTLPTYYLTKNNISNRIYSFDGQTYGNFDDLFNDVSSKYFKSSEVTNERYKWSINNGNSTLYFSDPKLLRDEAMKHINLSNGYSSYNIEKNPNYWGANGELTSEALSKIHFGNYDDLKQTIYRGRNNSIFSNEEEAKRSYLSIHDAYYFNNLYFSNKEQLELYLNNEYFLDEHSEGYQGVNKVVSILNSSNGSKSSAINQNDLFSDLSVVDEIEQKNVIDAKKSFANFVALNTNKFLQFKNENQNNTVYSYYKKNDISSSAQLINEFENPDYTRLYENNGKNTYIVDLDKDDDANLFGSYLISSSKALEMMMKKDHWYKTNSTNRLITKQKDAYLLSSLIENLLISDDKKPELPINIRAINDNVLIPYFNLLKSNYISTYYEFVNFLNIIKKGKNFNKFYELILSFTWLINNLIASKASENIIIETKKTFNEISLYLDQLVYLAFPENVLIGKNNKKISFVDIFNFRDNNKNLNTDINYYVDEISKNNPQFLVALAIMTFGVTNSTFNGCAIEFEFNKFSELVAKAASYPEEKMEKQYYDDYKFIYDLFSTTGMEHFFNMLEKTEQFKGSNLKDKEIIVKEIGVYNYFKLEYSLNPTMFDYFSTKNEFYYDPNSTNRNVFVTNKNSIFYDMPVLIANKIIKINNKAKEDSNKISFKNFMLIKMLLKIHSNKFSIDNLLNNFDNDDVLNSELNKLIDKILAADFSKNFQITQNSIDVLFKVAKTQNYSVEQENRLEVAKDVFKEINFIIDEFQSFTNTIDSFANVANSALSFVQLTSKAMNLASGVFGAIGIAMSAVSLFLNAFTPETKFISYVYENEEGQKYIWDGGRRTTMLWGLWETKNIGIEKMKLIGPIKIFDANNKEEYYFNGTKYDDLDRLKKEQLREIINGNYYSKSALSVYSWENIEGEFSSKHSSAFEEKDLGDWESIKNIDLQTASSSSFVAQNVVQYIYQKIAQDIANGNKNSQYFNSSFQFAGGINAGFGDDKNVLISNILNNIKTIKIAQLPNIGSDWKPISIDSFGEDGSISKFILPSKSWSFSIVSYNNTNHKYVIYDPNIKEEKDRIFEEPIDVVKIIEQQFFDQFDVDYKNVIKYDVQTTNLYSELSSSISAYNVHSAKLSNGQTQYFLNVNDALDWILTKMDFTMYEYPIIENIYEYNGIMFNSKQEFRNYVLENMEVKNG